ncbi:MAG: Arc family DNA-binding protein [Hoeflea sp. D1-CHI-28]
MVSAKQTDPQFKLRLPAELKARIEKAAFDNNRSMNAEIVHRLDSTFAELEAHHIRPYSDDQSGDSFAVRPGDHRLFHVIEELEKQLANLKTGLQEPK